MPWLRLLVLWIAMIAVPFQAHASATMAFCGSGHTGPAAGTRAAATAREASGRDHAHDHAAAVDHAASAASAASADPPAPTDTAHQCATCGACHATALTGWATAAVAHDLPLADLAEPFFAMTTNTSRVPEKPPRG